MASNLFGSMLTGMASGLQNYQQTQNDLDYLRQSRAATLVQQDQANQLNQLKIQQEAQQIKLADDTNNYARQALSPADALASADNTPGQQGQAVAGQAAPNAPHGEMVANPFRGQPQQGQPQEGQPQQGPAGGTSTGTGVQTGKSTSGLKTGAYSIDQYAAWDKQFNFKPGTAYALIMSESGGDPNAVSSAGAVGPTQVLPSTAANPGFGLTPGNARDPAFGFSYFKKLLDMAGGDYQKAAAYYKQGPNAKGDALNTPSTKTYIDRQNKYASQFNAATTAQQAQSTPTPADHVETAERAGVSLTPVQMTQAVTAQDRLIQGYDRAAMQAARDGNVPAAQMLAAKAEAMRKEQLDLSEKRNKVQTEANTEVSKLAAGVTDQSSYDNLQAQVQQNPAMQAAVAGLNLSGDFNADRNKIQTLAARTVSLKEQEQLRIQRDDAQIKQAKERREQEQYDRQRMQEAQQQQAAQQQDEARRQQAAQSGMPYVPAMETSLPKGTAPAVVQKTRETNAKSWAQYDKDHEAQRGGAERVTQLTTDMINRVTRNPDMVGGAWTTFRAGHAPWALSQDQQVLLKDAETMVTEAQRSVSPGAQRSAATAAYAGILSKTKPNLSMGPQAFVEVANNFYYMNAAQKQMNEWVDKFREANPDATPTQATLLYRRYERSLGPSTYTDPKTHQQVPNSKSIPYLPNGQENPDYVSPESYFAHEGAK